MCKQKDWPILRQAQFSGSVHEGCGKSEMHSILERIQNKYVWLSKIEIVKYNEQAQSAVVFYTILIIDLGKELINRKKSKLLQYKVNRYKE